MHYICTGGCRGESNEHGTCENITCPKHGTPLTSCDCTDGKHHGQFDQDSQTK